MDRLSTLLVWPGLPILSVCVVASLGGFLSAFTARRLRARITFGFVAGLCALVTASALWQVTDPGWELVTIAFVLVALMSSAVSLVLFGVGLALAWRGPALARVALSAAPLAICVILFFVFGQLGR